VDVLNLRNSQAPKQTVAIAELLNLTKMEKSINEGVHRNIKFSWFAELSSPVFCYSMLNIVV
jgi:hypothetical protein